MNESQGYMSADMRMRAMPEPTATLNATVRKTDVSNYEHCDALVDEWGVFLEATYDPDNERMEDREV